MKHLISLPLLLLAMSSLPASAEVIRIVEDFEDIQPEEDPQRGWSFNVISSDEGVAAIGDNHVLRGNIDNWGVNLVTKKDGSNPWVGDVDFRSLGAVLFSVATRGSADFTNTIREMSLLLINDNGTPDNYLDDFGFYLMSPKTYNFDSGELARFVWPIPTEITGETPEGWKHWDSSGAGSTDFTWDEVITNVDQVQVNYYNPEFFYIFQNHKVIVDNITLGIDAARMR